MNKPERLVVCATFYYGMNNSSTKAFIFISGLPWCFNACNSCEMLLLHILIEFVAVLIDKTDTTIVVGVAGGALVAGTGIGTALARIPG